MARSCGQFFKVWQEILATNPRPCYVRFIPSDTVWRNPVANALRGKVGPSLTPSSDAAYFIRARQVPRVEFFHSLALKTRKSYWFSYEARFSPIKFDPVLACVHPQYCPGCSLNCALLVGWLSPPHPAPD